MGEIKFPKKVKLFTAIMFRKKEDLEKVLEILKEKFGIIDFELKPFLVDYTEYYFKEMGKPLYKGFYSFEKLIHPKDIVSIKLFTNEVEKDFSDEGKRRINIDPGYLEDAKIVLVSTKNYAHRIYLSSGIYGEVSLIYRRNLGWTPLMWTYQDYAFDETLEFFLKMRKKYLQTREMADTL